MSKRIVYTRHDGGVSIVCPSANCMRWMSTGGRWGHVTRGWLDAQIERQIAAGHNPNAARRFTRALLLGGCTQAEALAIIRDRDCVHLGSAHELWDANDVPRDRWFRDAWRRSHNGGPILIDMPKARRIQWRRIKTAVEMHNRPRLALGRKPHVPLWGELGNAIRHARDEEELRRVWPALATIAQRSNPAAAPPI